MIDRHTGIPEEEGSGERMKPVVVCWLRRDLRLEDHRPLQEAAEAAAAGGSFLLLLFVFDPAILDPLSRADARVTFIYDRLGTIDEALRRQGSSLLVRNGDPLQVLTELSREYPVRAVFAGEDYEPYARRRDRLVAARLEESGITFRLIKDQVIFSPHEILKRDGTPYTVYTPYSRTWLAEFERTGGGGGRSSSMPGIGGMPLVKCAFRFPALDEIGFVRSGIAAPDPDFDHLADYDAVRDNPALDRTTYAGIHLRFGTISIRKLAALARGISPVYLGELIWREFFMQILYNFPESAEGNFRGSFPGLRWRNARDEFDRWCRGETGFPLVDAGMRQLEATGFMHNRVRMAASGFLCKDLLIDWRWGEAWFAAKLLDYEMASNVGNWQWAAGTGCDSVPYFRVFNPETQQRKFDPRLEYVRRWVPEFALPGYPNPMVDHAAARIRAIDAYRAGKSPAGDTP